MREPVAALQTQLLGGEMGSTEGLSLVVSVALEMKGTYGSYRYSIKEKAISP